MDKGCKIQLAEAKALQRRRGSGLLSKSLGKVVRTYRSDGVTVGLVGPRRGFAAKALRVERKGRRQTLIAVRLRRTRGGYVPLKGNKVIKLKRAAGFRAGEVADPASYGAKVEKGHKRGKGRSAARAYPYLRPAAARTTSAVLSSIKADMAAATKPGGGE